MGFVVNYENTIPSSMPPDTLKKISLIGKEFFNWFFAALISIPFMLYFSYKKQGTVLLFSSVLGGVLVSILFVFDIPKFYQMFTILSALQNSVDVGSKWTVSLLKYALFCRFSTLFVTVIWSIFCYKVRLLNLKQHFNKVMSNETYKSIFVTLETISEVKILDDFYGKSIREYPEIEKFLTRNYKKKKSQLSCLANN